MALQNLQTYFESVNRNEFTKLIEQPCVVTEKVQASSFHVKVDDTGYLYYKSGNKSPMNRIDRTLSSYYEPAIKFFRSIEPEVRQEIPKNWKFGFDYMTEKKTVDVEYDKLPKNNLILTHIQVLSNADHSQIKKVIRDPKVLYKWADILGVQRPQVIFEGTLQSDQKDALISILEASERERQERFKIQGFARTMYSIFNRGLNKTALNDSLDQSIDSIVINFFEGKTAKTFKICEEDKKPIDRKPADSYQISLLDIVEFVGDFNLKEIELEAEQADQRYIDLICVIFNDYIKNNAHRYVGVKFDRPEFSDSDHFKVSTKFIDNTDTIELIEDNETLSHLFQIMIGSFRNKRKKETDVINQDLMDQINELVNRIESKVMSSVKEDEVMSFRGYILNDKMKRQKSPINEGTILTFKQYLNK